MSKSSCIVKTTKRLHSKAAGGNQPGQYMDQTQQQARVTLQGHGQKESFKRNISMCTVKCQARTKDQKQQSENGSRNKMLRLGVSSEATVLQGLEGKSWLCVQANENWTLNGTLKAPSSIYCRISQCPTQTFEPNCWPGQGLGRQDAWQHHSNCSAVGTLVVLISMRGLCWPLSRPGRPAELSARLPNDVKSCFSCKKRKYFACGNGAFCIIREAHRGGSYAPRTCQRPAQTHNPK